MTALTAWQNFYVIVGSSAGALIGLQFVVMSLITSAPGFRIDPVAGSAFGTPTIMHFCGALMIAAILCAPWDTLGAPGALCGLVGLGGVIYVAINTRRMRKQTAYRPEFEDWLFHCLLPFAAYITLAVSGYAARAGTNQALFAIGGAALLLLFIGIHNAWDAVTYHVFVQRQKKAEGSDSGAM